MKTIKNLPIKHSQKIASISDERNNGDGWWIYLTKDYADFNFDPWSPTRTIHEQKLSDCISRLRRAQVVTDSDLQQYPHLK